jgi:hypothetical protein
MAEFSSHPVASPPQPADMASPAITNGATPEAATATDLPSHTLRSPSKPTDLATSTNTNGDIADVSTTSDPPSYNVAPPSKQTDMAASSPPRYADIPKSSPAQSADIASITTNGDTPDGSTPEFGTPNGIAPNDSGSAHFPLHNKLLEQVVRTPGRQPSPQPTHLSVPGASHSNNSRILQETGPGYVAPKFEGKEQQMEDGKRTDIPPVTS